MARYDHRDRIYRSRSVKKDPLRSFLRHLPKRMFACLVIMAMVLSGTKMPVAYAYFTATAEQAPPFVFEINGVNRCGAHVHFLDNHLIDENNSGPIVKTMQANTPGSSSDKTLQAVTTKETVSAVINLEDGFRAEDINVASVRVHYGDRSSLALTGFVRGDDLVVEFDRAELVSWFDDLGDTPNLLTFEVTGNGLEEGQYEFMFSGTAEIKLVGAYETTAVRIDGPDGFLIPEGSQGATGTYLLINQSGTILEDTVWTVAGQAVEGITLNEVTGVVIVDAATAPGSFTIEAEFERADGAHAMTKTVDLVADPHLKIVGPGSITIGAEPEQYTLQTRDNPVLEHIDWQIAPKVDGVTVDRDGLVKVADDASAREFTLAVEAEVKGLPVSDATTVQLEEPPAAAPPVVAPEQPADLPANAIVIRGEDLILIPSGKAAAQASYTATDRDGNMLPDVVWSIIGISDAVTFDNTEGVLSVTNAAHEGTVTLEATLEVLDNTGEPEGMTTVFYGKKNIALAQPAPVAVRINGPESILIPETDPEHPDEVYETYDLTAEVLDQKGNILAGEEMEWSLGEDTSGVSIDPAGVLTITSAAAVGMVTIVVTAGEIVGTLKVALADTLDADTEDPDENTVPGGAGGPDDPPIREEEPDGTADPDDGDNPDGGDPDGDDPGADEDINVPVEPEEPGEGEQDPVDEPEEPEVKQPEEPAVQPEEPEDGTNDNGDKSDVNDDSGAPGNEATEPEDSPGEPTDSDPADEE